MSALRTGTELQCDGREGRRTVALFEAVYAASDGDSWITVNREEIEAPKRSPQ